MNSWHSLSHGNKAVACGLEKMFKSTTISTTFIPLLPCIPLLPLCIQQISQSRQGELAQKRSERLEAERVSSQRSHSLVGVEQYAVTDSADLALSSLKQSGWWAFNTATRNVSCIVDQHTENALRRYQHATAHYDWR